MRKPNNMDVSLLPNAQGVRLRGGRSRNWSGKSSRLQARASNNSERTDRDIEPGRQAAGGSFSRGLPKRSIPSGRGASPARIIARKAFRTVPEKFDETYEAPLPEKCPQCGGRALSPRVREGAISSRDSARRPIYRRFNVAIGQCTCCGQRVQGRHPLQTSDALGCCRSQVGSKRRRRW